MEFRDGLIAAIRQLVVLFADSAPRCQKPNPARKKLLFTQSLNIFLEAVLFLPGPAVFDGCCHYGRTMDGGPVALWWN